MSDASSSKILHMGGSSHGLRSRASHVILAAMRVGLACLTFLTLGACAKDPTAPTEIYLGVVATVRDIDHVVLAARDRNGITDQIDRPTTDRDINIDPLIVRLIPNGNLSDDIILLTTGFKDGKKVVSVGEELLFYRHARRDLELVMNQAFLADDVDEDGYRLCGTGPKNDLPCDCDDLNAQINPFAREVCGNSVDEDCDGSTTEGC